MAKKNKIKSPQQLWENISTTLVHFIEGLFFNLGVIVARHPWRTVILSWMFVFLSCIGLMRFHIEKNPMKLWVPPESDFYYDTNWYINKFGTAFRFQKVLITADNVLDPKVIKTLRNITEEVNLIKVKYKNQNYTMKELCYNVPVVNFFSTEEKPKSPASSTSNNSTDSRKGSKSDFSDPTLWIDSDFYCGFINNFSYRCLQYNILDLWKSDPDLLSNMTKQDVISKINNVKFNPTTGHPTDYTKLLGGVTYNKNGDVISAKSILLTWFTEVNMTAVDLNEVGNIVGTEDWVSPSLALWESKFLELLHAFAENEKEVNVFYEAGRSFADLSGAAMFQDLDKLSLGIILMFIYIQFALSRCNWLEIRLTLGSVGLLYIGMSYFTAISWCSIIGISFGPVHSSLPFLLMGLGIDDMFVMKACWDNLSDSESKKSLPIKVGLMLKHAGVSIVITSFTDIVALLIGAITILPSLKSFCIYAAMGVFFIFCFSVTFYVAVFTLDLKRIECNRNSILFCYKHKKTIKISHDKTILEKMLANFYKNFIFTTPIKILVILFTLIVTGFSIEAIFRLEQKFDPKWFIPNDTYYKEFLNTLALYYPDEGHMAMVFLGEMDYRAEFKNIHDMVQNLQNDAATKNIVPWTESFHGYVLKNFQQNLLETSVSNEGFNHYLSKFLFSPIGGRFIMNFKFEQPLQCGVSVTNITASSISFDFINFDGPNEYIPAMHRVKDIILSANITTGDGYRSVWSKAFANWVTDEIISVEVERNIELALLCVMICTIVLITNLQMCLWIFICVLLTIINVLGMMQRWGMTVDIVCCIGMELAIGLCVDYAAHVGHTFLTISEGTRTERAFKTVTSIGMAVLLGGGSTMLSLSLLSTSKAYTFQSFFKIFFLVILFGLFYGLIFLPVVLSLIGPRAHKVKIDNDVNFNETIELNGKDQATEKQIVIDSYREVILISSSS